jgi:hypothetical protein
MIFKPPPIPTYWSPEQALEIMDFLEQLVNAIWWVHGGNIQRAAQNPLNSPPPIDTDPDVEDYDLNKLPF